MEQKIVFEPQPKQALGWNKLMDDITEVLVYGGAAGGGKTALGCAWQTIMCVAYPGTRYYIGRSELKRLKQSIMPSMSETRDKILKIPRDTWKFNGQESCYRFKNSSQIDLLDLKFIPSDPLYERYGSLLYTSGWIEEAGEVHFAAFDVLKSRIGRWMNTEYNIYGKTFISCNPKKNWLYTDFWRPWKNNELPEDACFIPALYSDNKYIAEQYEKKLNSIKDPVLKARLKDGNWEYADDKSALLAYDDIIDMFSNQYAFDSDEEMYITCDVARFGHDKAVIMLWQGWYIKNVWDYGSCTTTELEDKIKSIERQHRVPRSHVVIDSGGVGGGPVDHLPGCKSFVGGARPMDKDFDKYKKDSNEYEFYFANLRSQSAFYAAEQIIKRRVGVYDSVPRNVKDNIIAELEQWKKRDIEKDDNKVALIKKEDMKENLGGRSPDYADNIMMRSFFDLSEEEFAFEMV